MRAQLQGRLQDLSSPERLPLLTGIQRGIEKESLRISPDGRLAQTPHPRGLGSALTNSNITTDYSEALLEFITPVSREIGSSLEFLEDIHSYVYQELDDELLWCASMPCITSGDDSIPVAQYGSSNVARMKTVYRYGLGNRYGRRMQAIAGIHYNFSMPGEYWHLAWQEAGRPGELTGYISDRYLGLIRNFKRHSWLLIYLFGASPAVCASFLRGRDHHQLQAFDSAGKSLYLPYGTALRMGDLGYNSETQKGLNICYNCLDSYVETLRDAIRHTHPPYTAYPAGEGGDYQQLNAGLLQIENEFYSPIRPKRVAFSGETPLSALRRGGVEYIEVRCIDVSPFTPAGLDTDQIRFLDCFLLHCLLADSPDCDDADQARQAHNLEAVVNRGRQPDLRLQTEAGEASLQELAGDLLGDIRPVAALMDRAHASDAYNRVLALQQARIDDPELTPSARMLREMRERDLPFFRLAMSYSQQWAEYYRERSLSPAVRGALEAEAARSMDEQRAIERDDQISFEEYLARFYAQYDAL